MPDSIVKETMREIEPLDVDDPVGSAARKRSSRPSLPALPAVDAKGKFAGHLRRARVHGRALPRLCRRARLLGDDLAHHRRGDRAPARLPQEPIAKYLTTDHVLVEDDYSDTQLAELFLHHRVLIIPIATDGRVHAVVTRNDFFDALVGRFIKRASGSHDIPDEAL